MARAAQEGARGRVTPRAEAMFHAAEARGHALLGVSLGLQVFIVLAGALRIIPVAGITSPFLSYGGSSMVSVMLGIGLLVNVSMRRQMFRG